jgi:hypothetical protein
MTEAIQALKASAPIVEENDDGAGEIAAQQ